MNEHKAQRNSSSGPPNPLDFPIKDPLLETYEGRWAQLPPIQKVGLTVVLGFWCLFIATLVFSEGRAHYLNWLLPILVVATILGLLLVAGITLMRNRQRHATSQSGPFSILQVNIDGHPLFAMVDMGMRNSPERQVLPFFLGVSTPLTNPTSDGLPTRSDAENLNAWEDAVEASLRSAGKFVFVGRVTWNGHRELLYYLKSEHPAIESLKTLLDSHSTRQFTFGCERDGKWTKADLYLNRG